MPAKPNSPTLLPVDAYVFSDADKQRFADERGLGMVEPHDPVLCLRAAAVAPNKIKTVRVQQVIEQLFAAARGQRASRKKSKGPVKRRTLVGLAAPQIGHSL